MNWGCRILLASLTFCALSCGGNNKTPSQLPFPLVFHANTDKTSYQRGETIKVTLTVTNTGQQEINFVGVQIDIKILDESGRKIWQRSEAFPVEIGGEPTPYSLLPKETISFSGEWDQRLLDGSLVPPGRYLAKIWLRGGMINETTFNAEEREALLSAISPIFTIQ